MEVQWVAAVFGITGAVLLGFNIPKISKWGWLFYLGGSGAWMIFGILEDIPAMVLTSVVFIIVEIRGFIRYSRKE